VTVENLQTGRYTEQFVQLMRHQADRAAVLSAARENFRRSTRAPVPAEIMGGSTSRRSRRSNSALPGVRRADHGAHGSVAIAFRRWAAARFGPPVLWRRAAKVVVYCGIRLSPKVAQAIDRRRRVCYASRPRPLRLDIAKIVDPATRSGCLRHEVSRGRPFGNGVSAYAVGDRVVAAHHVPCGECHYCRRGSESMRRVQGLEPIRGFADTSKSRRSMSGTRLSCRT
jgi:hypothetical protein